MIIHRKYHSKRVVKGVTRQRRDHDIVLIRLDYPIIDEISGKAYLKFSLSLATEAKLISSILESYPGGCLGQSVKQSLSHSLSHYFLPNKSESVLVSAVCGSRD